MENVRVVAPGGKAAKWAVRTSFRPDATISTHVTQRDAIDAARLDLGPGGGVIRVCGVDGQLRRTMRVAAREAVAGDVSHTDLRQRSPSASPSRFADVADIAFSVKANARGEEHDIDGDGRDDGEAALSRLLDTNDGSPAMLFFKGTGWAINVLLSLVLPLLAAYLGISFRGAETLGTTYWTVYIATIAWSGGVSIASFVFFLRPKKWTGAQYGATIAGGFAASNCVAAAVGGATMASASTLAVPELYRVFWLVPRNRQGAAAILIMFLLFFIWLVAAAGFAAYGLIGLVLGFIVGVAIGWLAAHRVRAPARHRSQPSGAPPPLP
jgi:hypothetical protein